MSVTNNMMSVVVWSHESCALMINNQACEDAFYPQMPDFVSTRKGGTLLDSAFHINTMNIQQKVQEANSSHSKILYDEDKWIGDSWTVAHKKCYQRKQRQIHILLHAFHLFSCVASITICELFMQWENSSEETL